MTYAKQDLSLADPPAYQQKMLALLVDRDPLDVMSETPGRIESLVRGHSVEQMQSRPYAGKWTPNEIVGHLSDVEWVLGFRGRMMLSQVEPELEGMDQELWVTGQRHNERDPSELLEMFRTLREHNLKLWRRLGPSERQRVGRHSERGLESLDHVLRMYAGHDLSHIDQLTRYLAAVGQGLRAE